MNRIIFTKVSLPFGWLGNMSPHEIEYHSKIWRTSEAVFQARRFPLAHPVRELIRLEKSPMGAKMIAKKNKELMKVVPQSEEDLELMDDVLRMKLDAHPLLVIELLKTGDAEIIEDCSRRPHGSGLFWGAALQPDGSWKGENQLGRIWENLRLRIRDGRSWSK